jgi:hypothetical protein
VVIPLKKRPTEYLRQLYFDSAVFTPEALRHLVAECGASQIVMATDYPYAWTSTAVDPILGAPSLSDAERAAIRGDTACALLGIASYSRASWRISQFPSYGSYLASARALASLGRSGSRTTAISSGSARVYRESSR